MELMKWKKTRNKTSKMRTKEISKMEKIRNKTFKIRKLSSTLGTKLQRWEYNFKIENKTFEIGKTLQSLGQNFIIGK